MADGLIGRALDRLEEATGQTLVASDRLTSLQEAEIRLEQTRKELDLLGWTALDYVNGNSQELTSERRREWARKSRVAWMNDPMAGAAVDLMNDFVFGRGVPKPRAKDRAVQEIVDEFWSDRDNQAVLTSYEAQVALGSDLTIQSNVFLLIFDGGDDGRVKLGLLEHDSVNDSVTDPENRLRVLYYVAKERKREWDYENDRVKMDVRGATMAKTLYYPHWRNVEDAESDEARSAPVPKPPRTKRAEGKVYHLRINRTSEMTFGVPTMQRTLRWMNAYNDFMKARVDMMQAAASFSMRRRVKGTPNQLSKLAQRAISRSGDLATSSDGTLAPPRPGSILTENEGVQTESFKIDSGAANAMQDAQMLRAQISAATRFSQAYFGDASSSSLAVASAIELPILKTVEARQEVFEGAIRSAIDHVIEKAVDDGRLDTVLGADEREQISEAHEDKNEDEATTERDLSYDFSMPSPLRRMMGDLVNSAATVARTFDPNNTNPELSRTLLTLVLGEGFEMQDPADVVDRIFPEGYVDPAVAAAQAAAASPFGAAPGGGNMFGPEAAGEPVPGDGAPQGEANPYSVKQKGTPPERMQQAAITRGRDGEAVEWLGESRRMEQLPETVRARVNGRNRELDQQYDDEVRAIALDAFNRVTANGDQEP